MNKKRYEHLTKPNPIILTPLGTAPRHLGAPERAAWNELARNAHPGLLGRSDRILLEIAARLVVRMRHTDAKTGEFSALTTILGKLAMTPASRLKMDLPAPVSPVTASQTEEEKAWAALDELD